MKRNPEGNLNQPKFDFEQPTEAELREQLRREEALRQEKDVFRLAQKEMFDKVYPRLTPDEQKELRNITDPSKRREYIVRKYSKLFSIPE